MFPETIDRGIAKTSCRIWQAASANSVAFIVIDWIEACKERALPAKRNATIGGV
jgi:hypothetical protein